MIKPLLPIRHPDQDMFICDFGDVIPKSDIASMEHPLFTLSTKPDKEIRHYEHNGNTVEIAPSAYGLATIHDKDILIYCISQLMDGINDGKEPSRKVRFKAHDLLVTTNRGTGGREYKLLKQAFDRLSGTRITTDITTNNKKVIEGFGIIDNYKIVIEDQNTERMIELELTLSEWLYNSIIGKEILSINRDYFRLRKPIERRIYEIARKHCGHQIKWNIGLKNLHKKVGSSSSIKEFKRTLKYIVEHNHLPDYQITFDEGNVVFYYKNYKEKIPNNIQNSGTLLKPDTIEKAKRILKQQYDVYAVEYEWKSWWENSGKPELKSPDGAFIGFCKNKMEE